MNQLIANIVVLRVPEGGAPMLYLLAAAVACFGALYIRWRKQS